MEIVDDIIDLVHKIRRLKVKIIGVDGALQSGKTTFVSPALKIALHAKHIVHLDHYLTPHAGSFLHSLHKKQLKSDILKIAQENDHVIIEGLMLLNVFKALSIPHDMLIYSCDSLWYNQWEEYHRERSPLDRILHTEEVMTNKIEKAIHPRWRYMHFNRLTRELYTYTHEYKPYIHADFIFLIDKYF